MKNLIAYASLSLAITAPVQSFASVEYTPQVIIMATEQSQQAMPRDTSREILIIQNRGSAAALVKVDSPHTGPEDRTGWVVPAQGFYSFPYGEAPQNELYIKSEAGTQEVTFDAGY